MMLLQNYQQQKKSFKNGFWAKSRSEELKPSSLFVRFFVRMDDCTKRILAVVNDKMTEAEREKKQLMQKLQKLKKKTMKVENIPFLFVRFFKVMNTIILFIKIIKMCV